MIQLMYIFFVNLWGRLCMHLPLRTPSGSQTYSFVIKTSEKVHDLMMFLAIPFIILFLSTYATVKSIRKLARDFDQYLDYVAQNQLPQPDLHIQDEWDDNWQQDWDNWHNQEW